MGFQCATQWSSIGNEFSLFVPEGQCVAFQCFLVKLSYYDPTIRWLHEVAKRGFRGIPQPPETSQTKRTRSRLSLEAEFGSARSVPGWTILYSSQVVVLWCEAPKTRLQINRSSIRKEFSVSKDSHRYRVFGPMKLKLAGQPLCDFLSRSHVAHRRKAPDRSLMNILAIGKNTTSSWRSWVTNVLAGGAWGVAMECRSGCQQSDSWGFEPMKGRVSAKTWGHQILNAPAQLTWGAALMGSIHRSIYSFFYLLYMQCSHFWFVADKCFNITEFTNSNLLLNIHYLSLKGRKKRKPREKSNLLDRLYPHAPYLLQLFLSYW